MRKTLICIFFVSILFIACGKAEQIDYGDNYVAEQDFQTFSGMHEAVYLEAGFYVINQEGKIDFVDRKTGQATLLCGKPNCTHSDQTCNACFEAPLYIEAYNGYLYVIASGGEGNRERVLYRVSPDGSERKELKRLFSYEEEDASLALDFAIHRGSIYMVTNWIEQSRKKREQIWYRLPLEDGGEEKEEIYRIKGYSPMIETVDFDANYIYFHSLFWEDENLSQKVESNFRFDIRNGEVTEVCIPEGSYMAAAVQGKVYCAYSGQEKTELFCLEADGKDVSRIYEWKHPGLSDEGIVTVYRDRRFLYLESDGEGDDLSGSPRRCTVIDYGGHEVLQLGEDDLAGKSLCWSDSEQLLLQDYENGGYQLVALQ